MQSAPNCNKDDNEFDDDHESCHGLSPPFFYNYLRLFFAFVADGFGEVWAGILPLENVTYTQCIQPMSHLLLNNNRFTSDYPLWGEFAKIVRNDKFDAVAVFDLIIGQFF